MSNAWARRGVQGMRGLIERAVDMWLGECNYECMGLYLRANNRGRPFIATGGARRSNFIIVSLRVRGWPVGHANNLAKLAAYLQQRPAYQKAHGD